MNKPDSDRVIFFSIHDMSSGHYLSKAEPLLKGEIVNDLDDINDILEMYNISLFFEHAIYLNSWTDKDIVAYKEKVNIFKGIIREFITSINDDNFLFYFENIYCGYYESFWLLINNYKQFKKVSPSKIVEVLNKKPHQIRCLLSHKNLVNKYNLLLCEFLKSYLKSAEILLSIYEVENSFNEKQLYLPSCLTIKDKENIISSYVDSEYCNTNYLPIIQHAKKHSDFRLSDKTKLAVKRKYQQSIKDFLDSSSSSSFEHGVAISYPENASKTKYAWFEQGTVHYEFSLDFIKENNHPYMLYRNFKTLFEYMDEHNIVALTSKESQLGVFERTLGVRSKTEYVYGLAFTQLEMASMTKFTHTLM